MMRRSFIAATVVSLALAGSTARAQANRGVNPLHYNNPLNQAGMYNSSPVLRYNNPLNQAGMYNNVPVLRYNNPIVQGNMYGNGGVYYGGNQSLFTGRSNAVRSNAGGSFVQGQTFGNVGGTFGNVGGTFGNVGGTFGAPTTFFGAAATGSPLFFAGGNPWYQGSDFGWGMPNPMGGNPGPGFDPTLAGNADLNGPRSFSNGQRLSESAKGDPDATAVLNGTAGKDRSAYKSQSASSAAKPKGKATRSTRRRGPANRH